MPSVSIPSRPSRAWRCKFRHRALFLAALLLATWKSQSLSPSLADAWVSPRWNQPPTQPPSLYSTGCGARESMLCCVVGVGTPTHRISTALEAKNTRKGKKRSGGPRGGGRRGKAKTKNSPIEDEEEASGRKEIRDPKRLRKRLIELHRRLPPNHSEQQQQQQQQQYLTPLKVCSVEVDDKEWWEQEGNENPYGARLWPSALAISEFLVDLGMTQHAATTNSTATESAPTTESTRCGLQGYEMLELGCGAGLVSIVAAECGANVVATDISPLALKLCRTGWKETQKLKQAQQTALQQKREQKLKLQQKFRQLRTGGAPPTAAAAANKPPPVREDEEQPTPMLAKPGSLNTMVFDLFSKTPLPVVSREQEEDSSSKNAPPTMVLAGAMMYEPELASILAQRAMEACSCGAWVVIGDDDTGEREGGRALFISALDRWEAAAANETANASDHEHEHEGSSSSAKVSRLWTRQTVQSKSLQWNEKQVQLLHLNAPSDVQEWLLTKQAS